MWFECKCGQRIKDISDAHSYKAHYISDKDWFPFWGAIDDSIENSGASVKEKEAACMKLRMEKVDRTMYQCFECGRLYLNDENNQLISFLPEDKSVSLTPHFLPYVERRNWGKNRVVCS